MSLFKEHDSVKEVDDTREVVHDFNRQVPFWSYQPVSYRMYEPFSRLRTELDDFLDRLFTGDIDDGNGDVLDEIICDYARQALDYLSSQQKEHEDFLYNKQLQAVGALTSRYEHREERMAKLAAIDKRLDTLKSRLEKNEFEGGTDEEDP